MQTQTQNERPPKLWTKYYLLIICYTLLTSTANNMLMTGIPLYAIYLGGNNSIAGLMMGLFMIFAILFRPLFGTLIDTKGRRMVLITGALICTTAFLSYTFAFSVGMLLILRAFNGIGFSANTNASGTVTADIIPKSRLAEGIGYYGVSNTIATAIGPALTLVIIKIFSYQALFIVAFIIGLVSIFISYFINYEKMVPKVKIEIEKLDKNNLKKVLTRQRIADMIFEKKAILPSFVMLFAALGLGSITTFIPIYANTRGIENISIYFTVYAVALLFTRLFGGRAADRYGESTVILPGFVLMILSFITLAFSTSISLFLVSAVLYGLGFGLVQPTLNAIMIRRCPPNRRGAGSSTFFTAMDIGSGGGAVLWGVVSQKTSFTLVYLLCAVCILVSWIAYSYLLQRKLKEDFDADAIVA